MGTSQVLYIISRVLYYCVLLFQSLINTKEISALSAFTEKSHNLLSVLGGDKQDSGVKKLGFKFSLFLLPTLGSYLNLHFLYSTTYLPIRLLES